MFDLLGLEDEYGTIVNHENVSRNTRTYCLILWRILMKELWDIYDNNKAKTGIVKERGSSMENGQYHLVALIWIKGFNGKYLISKRSSQVDGAGKWQPTGGSVISGESSIDGAIREVKEEIGLNASADKMKLFTSKFVGEDCGWIADYWHLYDDINIQDVICQEEEVADVMWASIDEIKDLIKKDQFFHGDLHLGELDIMDDM